MGEEPQTLLNGGDCADVQGHGMKCGRVPRVRAEAPIALTPTIASHHHDGLGSHHPLPCYSAVLHRDHLLLKRTRRCATFQA